MTICVWAGRTDLAFGKSAGVALGSFAGGRGMPVGGVEAIGVLLTLLVIPFRGSNRARAP